MVGQPVKIDGERVLSKHGDKKEVLKIIRNSSFKSAVKIELNSLVIRYHSSIEFEESSSLGHHHLAAVGYCLYHLQKFRLLWQQSGGMMVNIDVLEHQILFGNGGAQKMLAEHPGVFL